MGRKSKWVRAGRKLEADIYVDLESGRTKHVGTKVTDGNVPKVYDGEPSLKGYVAGKIVQSILGRTKRR